MRHLFSGVPHFLHHYLNLRDRLIPMQEVIKKRKVVVLLIVGTFC